MKSREGALLPRGSHMAGLYARPLSNLTVAASHVMLSCVRKVRTQWRSEAGIMGILSSRAIERLRCAAMTSA